MNIRTCVFFPIILMGFAAPAPAGALEPLALSNAIRSIPMGRHIEILEDRTRTMSFDDVRSKKYEGSFKPSTEDVPNYAFSSNVYWIRFSLKNTAEQCPRWLLELSYPLMDHIEFYFPGKNGKYATTAGGYRYPFSAREYKHRHFIFPFILKPGEPQTFYLRLQNDDRMEIPLTLWTEKAFIQKDHDEQYVMGIYLGIIVVMFLFNLMLFISIREKTYLYYVLFLAAFGFFQLIQNGLVYEYFWPAVFESHNHVIPQSIALALMTMILFTQSYLNTKIFLPWIHRIFNAIQIVYATTIVLDFFIHYSISIQIQVVMAIATLVLTLGTGGMALTRRYRPAKFYMLAWTAIFSGGIIYALKVVAIVPSNFFTSYALQMGSVILIILLSFGLGDRINLIEDEKKDAQDAAIKAQREIINGMKEINRQKDAFLEETSKKNREIESLNVDLQEKVNALDTANRELALSEERYRFLVEGTNDIIFTMDENFNLTSANKAISTQLKLDPGEVASMKLIDLIYEDYDTDSVTKQLVQEKLDEFTKSHKSVQFKSQLKTNILSEPKDYMIRLEYISVGGTSFILGKASSISDDTLIKYFECEKQRFSIQNHLIVADDISQRVTRNLRKYFEPRQVNLIRLAFREMIINAIEHGNLNISYEEKSMAMDDNNYFGILARRQRDPRYKDRKVYIEYHIGPDKVAFKITDEGEGFDHQKILMREQEANEYMLSHGRGIHITRQVFDEITYNKKGNQVLLVKYIVQQDQAVASTVLS